MNEYDLKEYSLRLYLQDYPADLIASLLSTSDLKETLLILDKLQHTEHKEHGIFVPHWNRLYFRKIEHYEVFMLKVNNGFIRVSDLSDFLTYWLLDENISLYTDKDIATIKSLKEQTQRVVENGQGYRLVEVEFLED